jgi:Holliday junction resolvase RusA-like endonuclease
VTRKGKKPFVQNYTQRDDPVATFKAALRLVASQYFKGAPLTGPVRCDVICVFPRPERLKGDERKPFTPRPDRDNLLKSVQDALTGQVWRDDAQVYAGICEKWYAAAGEQPHTWLRITEDE